VTPRPPIRVVAIQIPALATHEAEAIIDLLGQLQGALWDTYGAAIVDRITEAAPPVAEHTSSPSDPSDDDMPF
jgi:hypothetical protein